MLIPDPIHDAKFKRLMESERMIRFFIGALLEETVESLAIPEQEFICLTAESGTSVFRLCFIATFKAQPGERSKALIEIRKALEPSDLLRFQGNDLFEQYQGIDPADGTEVILPIIEVLIVGSNLPRINTPCTLLKRTYFDMIEKVPMEVKGNFLEDMSPKTYVVQLGRMEERQQTLLNKLLSFFD